MHLPRGVRIIDVQANLAGIRQKLLERVIAARAGTITHNRTATRSQHTAEVLHHRLASRTSQEAHHITGTHQKLKTVLRGGVTLDTQHLRQIHQISRNPGGVRADAARLFDELRVNINAGHAVTQGVQLLTHTARTRASIQNLRTTRRQSIH